MENKKDELKIKIADVILKLNECERLIKRCIQHYLGSKNDHFVMEILLNNHIINLGSKLKLLFYILNEQKIENKALKSALSIMMTKRNAIAHSDNPLGNFMIVEEGEKDGIRQFLKIVEVDPEVQMYENGKFSVEKLEKILIDFDKYYEIAKNGLVSVSLKIKQGH